MEGNVSIWDNMLPAATLAYTTAYHRTIKESPFYLLYLRDPHMPYTMSESPKRPWYNVDSYKDEMAVISRKVYERCQVYLEEGRDKMEKYYKPSKTKPVKIGDRVFLRYVPKRTEHKKLQPIFDGPYGVVDKPSDVVVKIKDLRTSKVTTVHTDRIKVLHEDCIDARQCPSVRRAYPLHPRKSLEENELWSTLLTPNALETESAPELEETLDGDVCSPRSPEIAESEVPKSIELTEDPCSSQPVTPSPRYSLRSSSTVSDFPHVMSKPLEYAKK